MTSKSPPLHAQTLLRLVVPASFVALLCWEPMREATLIAMSSAFWQVASFVAATLWVLYALGVGWKEPAGCPALRSAREQVLFGMMALPEYGGAIAVMTVHSWEARFWCLGRGVDRHDGGHRFLLLRLARVMG